MTWRLATPLKLTLLLAMLSPLAAEACPHNPNALGVARTVQIDTTKGPRFGFQHYKVHDFLQAKEVILTFDDGPLPSHTRTVLKALAHHCTKATFFPVGRLAIGYPEVLREIVKAGHTVGSHTWSHKNLRRGGSKALIEIEKGLSAIVRAAGRPTSPFFRYPFLRHSKDTLSHLSKRNISVFSTDVDSFDFKYRPRSAKRMVSRLLRRIERNGNKGIVLLHDIQPVTAKALPQLLDKLKAGGFKIVHMTAKDPVTTVPKYDRMIEKHVKGLPAPGAERPTSSVVKTISGNP